MFAQLSSYVNFLFGKWLVAEKEKRSAKEVDVAFIGPGKGKLQPIYIDNLVEVFVRILGNPAYFGRTLLLGDVGAVPHMSEEFPIR